MLLVVRLLYMVLLVTISMLPFVGTVSKQPEFEFAFEDYAGVFIATFAFGAVVLLIDSAIKNKRLTTVFGMYLGVVAGLVSALLVGALLDLIAESWELTSGNWTAYLSLVKFVLGITLCYLAVSIVLTTKDDFRLVIPYVEFSKQVRGVRPLLLDTSALIDGRIDALGSSRFLDAPVVVPQFVIDELQTLADSSDKLKRERGRRGLDVIRDLQANPHVDVSIDTTESEGHGVDHQLLDLATRQSLRVVTTDYNLNKVAEIQGLTILNLNDLASALRPQVMPGEQLIVEISKTGEGQHQGVGYMPDGTMVVVEDAADRVGQRIVLEVTNSLQTSAGRMIFGRHVGLAPTESATPQMARSATQQPRSTARPTRRTDQPTRRNPRR